MPAQDHTATTQPRQKPSLWFAATASASLLLITAFEWSLIDWLTPLLYVAALGAVWLVFALAVLSALFSAFRHRRQGPRAALPLGLCLAAFLLAMLAPFTDLWLWVNFHRHQAEREAVVRQISGGELRPGTSPHDKLVALPPGSGLSQGGDQVIVERHDGRLYVLFFTYRGILDNYSGFLFVPPGGDPALFDARQGRTPQLIRYGEHWYFTSHH